MPILKITASADTTITDAFKPNTQNRAYFANMGAADSLEIFSISHSGSSPERSRALINFDINSLVQKRQMGAMPQAGSVNFILKMYNVQHPETLPKNYDIIIKPVSSSWDEGYGLDLENYTDNGQTQQGGFGVGWKFRSSTEAPYIWAAEGGDFVTGYDKVFHFDNGTEDVEVDVTNIVEAQIAGLIPSYGFAVMLSGAYEDGTNLTTLYTKRFSARSSEYFYKKPSLEARWESVVKDDRGDFYFSSPNLSQEDNLQNIYFYNKINSVLKDLPSNTVPEVRILNSYGEELTSSIQSQKVSVGTYLASFEITGSEDDELIDVWYSGSSIFFKSVIGAKVRNFSDTASQGEYILALTNLKKAYKSYETPSIKIFVRNKNWSPNIYNVATNTIETITLKNLYYKIFRIVDNMVIVDYGVSPIPYTKCSYDKNGNYFDISMDLFEPGYMYGIQFMIVEGDNKLEFENIFKFKVE